MPRYACRWGGLRLAPIQKFPTPGPWKPGSQYLVKSGGEMATSSSITQVTCAGTAP